jgi:hypothetical protein
MRVLIYSSCSLLNPHFGTQLNEAIKCYKSGHEVLFAYCNGVMCSCFVNAESNPVICYWCKKKGKKGLENLPEGVKIIPLNKNMQECYNNIELNFSSVHNLKNICYKNINIGYSVLSTYITLTRNHLPDCMDDKIKRYIINILKQAIALINAIELLVVAFEPEEIRVFNDRFYEANPLVRLATKYNIQYICNEVVGRPLLSRDTFRITYFENTTPHDIKNLYERCMKNWELNNLTDEQKINIGKSFYEKRRKGIPAGDKVYIKNQQKGKLPSNIDIRKRNIVIFNSSDDEYAAIGEKFEAYSLFLTQYDGIIYMLEQFSSDNDYHFYLRIHPNLKDIKYSYHLNLYTLQNCYNNITVIAANDDINTYDLMDIADKVVVFGSTTGIEAVYWNKPTILLAGSLYYYMETCYIPKTKEELLFLLQQKLTPGYKTNAIKYGFYILDQTALSDEAVHIDINPYPIKLLWRKTWVYKYINLFNSNLLDGVCNYMFFHFISRFRKNKFFLPEKQNY